MNATRQRVKQADGLPRSYDVHHQAHGACATWDLAAPTAPFHFVRPTRVTLLLWQRATSRISLGYQGLGDELGACADRHPERQHSGCRA